MLNILKKRWRILNWIRWRAQIRNSNFVRNLRRPWTATDNCKSQEKKQTHGKSCWTSFSSISLPRSLHFSHIWLVCHYIACLNHVVTAGHVSHCMPKLQAHTSLRLSHGWINLEVILTPLKLTLYQFHCICRTNACCHIMCDCLGCFNQSLPLGGFLRGWDSSSCAIAGFRGQDQNWKVYCYIRTYIFLLIYA